MLQLQKECIPDVYLLVWWLELITSLKYNKRYQSPNGMI